MHGRQARQQQQQQRLSAPRRGRRRGAPGACSSVLPAAAVTAAAIGCWPAAGAAAAAAGLGYHGRLTRFTLQDPSLAVQYGSWRDDGDWYWAPHSGVTGCYAASETRCRMSWTFRGRSLRLFGSFDGERAAVRIDGAVVRSLTAASSNSSYEVHELWSGSWHHLRARTLSIDVAEPPSGAAARPAWQGSAVSAYEGLIRLRYAEVTTGGWHPHYEMQCDTGRAAGFSAAEGGAWEVTRGPSAACGAEGVVCPRRRSVTPGAACHLEAVGRGFRVWHSVGARGRVLIDGVSAGVLSPTEPVTHFAAKRGAHSLSVVCAGEVEIAAIETLPDDGDPVVSVNAGGATASAGGAAYAADDDDDGWASSVPRGEPSAAPQRRSAQLTLAAAAAAGGQAGFAGFAAPLLPDLAPILETWRESPPGTAIVLRLPAPPGIYELRLWLAAAVPTGFRERTHSGAPSNAASPPSDEIERRALHLSPSAADVVAQPRCAVPLAAWFTQAETPHRGWSPVEAPGAAVAADPYSGLYCATPCDDGRGLDRYDFRAAYACGPRLSVSADGYNLLSPTGSDKDTADLGSLTGGVLHTPVELRHMVQVQESGVLEVVVAPPVGAPHGAAVHAAGLFAKDCPNSPRSVCFD